MLCHHFVIIPNTERSGKGETVRCWHWRSAAHSSWNAEWGQDVTGCDRMHEGLARLSSIWSSFHITLTRLTDKPKKKKKKIWYIKERWRKSEQRMTHFIICAQVTKNNVAFVYFLCERDCISTPGWLEYTLPSAFSLGTHALCKNSERSHTITAWHIFNIMQIEFTVKMLIQQYECQYLDVWISSFISVTVYDWMQMFGQGNDAETCVQR